MEGRFKISVWWDMDDCPIPKDEKPDRIIQNIHSAFGNINYAPSLVSIFAYSNTRCIPLSIQHALSSTGVSLIQVPTGVKDVRVSKILVDMLVWALDNPAPANILLISGDTGFSDTIHQLHQRQYTILLAHPAGVSPFLTLPAKIVWLWQTLSAGGYPLNFDFTSSNTTGTPITPSQRTFFFGTLEFFVDEMLICDTKPATKIAAREHGHDKIPAESCRIQPDTLTRADTLRHGARSSHFTPVSCVTVRATTSVTVRCTTVAHAAAPVTVRCSRLLSARTSPLWLISFNFSRGTVISLVGVSVADLV